VADCHGQPVGRFASKARRLHEVKLVESTLVEMVIQEAPQNLVRDNAYDSDKLDAELRGDRIEVIAPHRSNRKNKTQDGRRLRRCRRRWKIERLFAWLQNFPAASCTLRAICREFLGHASSWLLTHSVAAFMRWVLVLQR
jgi:hypothetical protein